MTQAWFLLRCLCGKSSAVSLMPRILPWLSASSPTRLAIVGREQLFRGTEEWAGAVQGGGEAEALSSCGCLSQQRCKMIQPRTEPRLFSAVLQACAWRGPDHKEHLPQATNTWLAQLRKVAPQQRSGRDSGATCVANIVPALVSSQHLSAVQPAGVADISARRRH